MEVEGAKLKRGEAEEGAKLKRGEAEEGGKAVVCFGVSPGCAPLPAWGKLCTHMVPILGITCPWEVRCRKQEPGRLCEDFLAVNQWFVFITVTFSGNKVCDGLAISCEDESMSNSQLRRPGRLLLQLLNVSISAEQSLTTSLMRSLHDNVSVSPEGLEESKALTPEGYVTQAIPAAQSEWLTLSSVSADFYMGKTYAFLTEGVNPILRVVARFLEPQSGRIRWKRRPLRRARLEPIAYIPRNSVFSSSLTVNDELLNALAASGQNVDSELFDDLVHLFRLSSVVDVPVQYLDPLARYQFLMARSLLMGARLLLLDEPTLGMSSASADELLELLSEVARAGFAVVMQTRSPEVAARCDEVFLLMMGQMRGVFPRPDVDILRLEYAGAMGSLGVDSDLSRSAVEGSAAYGMGRGNRVPGSGGDPEVAAGEEGDAWGVGEDDEEVAPRWMPTRHSDRAVLTPIPDALFFPEEAEQGGSEVIPEDAEETGVAAGSDGAAEGCSPSEFLESVPADGSTDDEVLPELVVEEEPLTWVDSDHVNDRVSEDAGSGAFGVVVTDAGGDEGEDTETGEIPPDRPFTWEELLPAELSPSGQVVSDSLAGQVVSDNLAGQVVSAEAPLWGQDSDDSVEEREKHESPSPLSGQVAPTSASEPSSATPSSDMEHEDTYATEVDPPEETQKTLPQIPVSSRMSLDPDSAEVIALAKGILKDLPGSVVPDTDSR